jgi:hypothetical protein
MKLVRLTKGLYGYALLSDDEKGYVTVDEAVGRWKAGRRITFWPLPEGVMWKHKRPHELPFIYYKLDLVEELQRRATDPMGLHLAEDPLDQPEQPQPEEGSGR